MRFLASEAAASSGPPARPPEVLRRIVAVSGGRHAPRTGQPARPTNITLTAQTDSNTPSHPTTDLDAPVDDDADHRPHETVSDHQDADFGSDGPSTLQQHRSPAGVADVQQWSTATPAPSSGDTRPQHASRRRRQPLEGERRCAYTRVVVHLLESDSSCGFCTELLKGRNEVPSSYD